MRELLHALPLVASGLKRPGVPAALQVMFTTLSPRHIPVLSYVFLDGPMTVGELADRLGLAMSTTSLMIKDLENAGLVARREDADDRRRRRVDIREEHRDTIATWLAHRTRPIRAGLERLSPAQRWTLSHGLQVLAEEFNRDSPTTAPDGDAAEISP